MTFLPNFSVIALKPMASLAVGTESYNCASAENKTMLLWVREYAFSKCFLQAKQNPEVDASGSIRIRVIVDVAWQIVT